MPNRRIARWSSRPTPCNKSIIESWDRRGESETQVLKRTTRERREATRTLCAMLNHRGSRVIFGVEPDGRIIGQMFRTGRSGKWRRSWARSSRRCFRVSSGWMWRKVGSF